MNELQQAIDALNNAASELEKRNAAQALGTAIGNALGTASGLWRSSVQIDAMSLTEINAWGANVAESVGDGPPGGGS